MANEYGNDYVVLTDEEGREIEFEVLGSVEVDGMTYVGLVEQFEDPRAQLESDGRMVVLKAIEDDNGEELLVTIDDEELAHVLPAFEEALGEEYDINGEEEE